MTSAAGGAVLAACEWIFADPDLPAVLARITAAGAGGIELSGEPGRPDRARVPEWLAAAGVRATGITATCRWPTEERDLAHPDAAARRRAVAYYRGCVELAAEVGAPWIGLIPAAVGRVAPLGDAGREWELAVGAAREVAAYAGECGVGVAIEAINRYESYLVSSAGRALAFADEVGSPNVGVILDAFHMQMEERDPVASVAAAAPRLLALHLADSNRRGLGEGHLDAAALVRAATGAGYRGPFVLEFTAPGPDPFRADKGPPAMRRLDPELRASVAAVRGALAPAATHATS